MAWGYAPRGAVLLGPCPGDADLLLRALAECGEAEPRGEELRLRTPGGVRVRLINRSSRRALDQFALLAGARAQCIVLVLASHALRGTSPAGEESARRRVQGFFRALHFATTPATGPATSPAPGSPTGPAASPAKGPAPGVPVGEPGQGDAHPRVLILLVEAPSLCSDPGAGSDAITPRALQRLGTDLWTRLVPIGPGAVARPAVGALKVRLDRELKLVKLAAASPRLCPGGRFVGWAEVFGGEW
ncbi:MAG TPA: hypothetical protein VD963_02160 [Phycisphaerales bacterium]|nr:hypothetical protein [Phycisphaerales bacterium]